jgi:signal transduction histidine kinase
MVEKSVNIVHQFARDLRPTVLDDLGLIPALHSFLKDFTKRAKVRVHFTAFAKVEQLSSARRTVLYRVAQSALTNVAQHAEATQVDVSIQKVSNTVRLEIHDNGKSFDVEQVLFAKRYKRLGLLSMRERVEMVGGGFSVASAPGQGTTICARVPFAEGHEKRGGHRLIRPSRHLDRP